MYSLAICAFRVNTLKHTEYTEYTEKAPNKLAIGIKASVYSLCDLCIPSEYFKAHPDNYRGTEYTEKAQNNPSNGIKSSVYSPCKHFFKEKMILNIITLKKLCSWQMWLG